MFMSCTLIQIVSDEAMPNLLAAMALKPENIIHLTTPRMLKAAKALERAYGQAYFKTNVRFVQLAENPGMIEMNDTVAGVIADSKNPVINITGGTKLMSIGVYAAATRAKVPSLYVDTAGDRFVDGLSGDGFAELFPDGCSISRVSRQLTVNCVATANGMERVSSGMKWKDFAAVADYLLRNQNEEGRCHDVVAKLLKDEPRGFMQVRTYYSELYEKCIRLPDEVCELGVGAGLFEKREDGYYPNRYWFGEELRQANQLPPHIMFKALEKARWPFAFFNGNWWEVAVMRYLNEKGTYRDLRWSVEAGSRYSSSTDMEEDILGIDSVNLLYVSCKRGGEKAKLSRVLEDVNSSARRIGGRFAHKMLAVYVDLNGSHRSRIENRCRELHIDLLDRQTVASVPQFTGQGDCCV
jgi:hypothetical protein